MLIYVTGPIGYETALRLYEEDCERVKNRFPEFFINSFLEIKKNMAEIDLEKYGSGLYIREMRSGGLFETLWDLCEEAGCGCEIDFERIPVRQEVIEVLELFKESPYEVPSAGSRLIFSNEQIFGASLIGFTNETKERIIDFGSHRRYLTPASRRKKDEENRKGER